MDIFEASDYDFLLSRRAKKMIAWTLLIGVAWVPPVRAWYFGQVHQHAEHIARDFMSLVFSNGPDSKPSPLYKPVREEPDPLRQPLS